MEYFRSYEDLEVHKCMLEDKIRNEAYRKAIFDNKKAIKDKIVLDVGAGTGILSIFCAQAGAAKVYAVEASETYKLATELVQENNFENIIQVVHSRVEDLTLPEDEKVDIIVSEWMGQFLLHEGMLDSVIIARDKFLRPGGLMFPEYATLFCAPCSVPSFNHYWEDVSGVSMTCFAKALKAQTSKVAKVMTVNNNDILSPPEVLLWMNLYEVTLTDIILHAASPFSVINKAGRYQGICLWFTCLFPADLTEPVYLSTEPKSEKTHWQQTVLVLGVDVPVLVGTPIHYSIKMKRLEDDPRKYSTEVEMLDDDDVEHPEFCACYKTRCILTRAVMDSFQNSLTNGTL